MFLSTHQQISHVYIFCAFQIRIWIRIIQKQNSVTTSLLGLLNGPQEEIWLTSANEHYGIKVLGSTKQIGYTAKQMIQNDVTAGEQFSIRSRSPAALKNESWNYESGWIFATYSRTLFIQCNKMPSRHRYWEYVNVHFSTLCRPTVQCRLHVYCEFQCIHLGRKIWQECCTFHDVTHFYTAYPLVVAEIYIHVHNIV